MPFFKNPQNKLLQINKKYKNKKHIKNKESSLQNSNSRFSPKNRILILVKRVFSSTSTMKASLTVECALIVPIFMFAMCFVIYFSQIIRVNSQVSNAIYKAGRELALYSYAVDNNNLGLAGDIASYGISSLYLKSSIKASLGDSYFEDVGIDNGLNGIKVIIWDKEKKIDITASYYINLPFRLVNGDDKLKMIAKCKVRKWTGYEPNLDSMEASELIVYITPSGEVYHMSPNCTHIELSISEVSINNIESKRNTYGEKYYECNMCKGNKANVYITQMGNRYHTNSRCSGIKRTILKIPMSQVGVRKKCQRCGG